MGERPPDAAEMLTIAVTNTDRLVRLINDILDLERIDAGEDALDLRPCSVASLLADAVANVAGAAGEAGVAVTVHPVEAAIHADHDRVVQALTNLLGNAIKFSERGGEVILDGEVDASEVVLRVSDHGRGIPQDRLEDIFQRFRQVDASDARAKGGTGLGLPIVRSIAQRHGGRVEVESEVGEGSTFSLVLPLPRLPLHDADRSERASAVVLVEDDVDLRDVIRVGLDQHGVGVATASTAADAIERCRAESPDVLVLDVRLEEGSGYEVVRALRQDDRLRNLATVVYTVSDLTPEQRAALRLGETVFVTKGQQSSADLEREVLALLERVRERPLAG
jgi:CheY-like chemotaxis protein